MAVIAWLLWTVTLVGVLASSMDANSGPRAKSQEPRLGGYTVSLVSLFKGHRSR